MPAAVQLSMVAAVISESSVPTAAMLAEPIGAHRSSTSTVLAWT
jgi:hypothetical protein